MKDEKFLNDVLNGRLHVTMKQGIQITAQIETKEDLEGGVWVPKRREIIKVDRIHRKPEQTELLPQTEPKKRAKKSSKAK